ncbi:MAG: AAA family ATPase, partial [Bacillus sp. (in: Bacteria)]|nr:AAA family ATPase [Bacillus sp. (in: firmicutes)]
MKIVEMHIYGYGQLENVNITNMTDFQVFFGENEAGKSTIMAFIHSIFFGFPTKQQSELQYVPKQTSKYGGKIRIYHEEFGYVTIERVKGKATGDVTLAMDNGTIGGETLLKEILANFDKNLFQAIFSFNLHGLQNIHHMKSEDIGKFLFSAGTLGTEALSKTNSILQKELDFRFKPSGKKPVLNEKLQALHEISAELKKAAAKNKEYQNLVEKSEMLQQKMAEINGLLSGISEKVERLNEWKRIESIVKEEKWTKEVLERLGEIQFPARGIERIEKLNQLIHPYNAEIISIADRIDTLKIELAALRPDLSFLENEPGILTMLDRVPIYEQLKLDMQQCKIKLAENEEKLSVIKEKLHLPVNEEDIFTINTNIYMKNQVEQVSRKSKKLIEVKEELEGMYQEEKNTLEDIEKELRPVERSVLAKQDRTLLEEQVNYENDKKSLEWELKALQDKIDMSQQANKRDKALKASMNKQKNIQFFCFQLILVGLIVYGFLTKQWVLLFSGVLMCIVITIFMLKNMKLPNKAESNPTLDGLREKEKEILQKLQSAEYMDITILKEKLTRDKQRHEELQLLKIKLNQQKFQYEKVIEKLAGWELEATQNKEKIVSLSSDLKIPVYIASSFLLEAFQQIEQFKASYREKRQLLRLQEEINQQQTEIFEGVNLYANRFLEEKGLDLHKAAYLLRMRLKEDHEKRIKSQERHALLTDSETVLKQKRQEQVHIQAEYTKLLSAARVETEQDFYELGEKAEKQGKLLEGLETIKRQLQYSTIPEQVRESFLQIHNSDELIDECSINTNSLQANLKLLQEEHA